MSLSLCRPLSQGQSEASLPEINCTSLRMSPASSLDHGVPCSGKKTNINSDFGAQMSIHDFWCTASMTQRVLPKLCAENLALIFWSLSVFPASARAQCAWQCDCVASRRWVQSGDQCLMCPLLASEPSLFLLMTEKGGLEGRYSGLEGCTLLFVCVFPGKQGP